MTVQGADGELVVPAHLVAWVVLERLDGRLLLARRSGVSYGDGLWGLPGGHAGWDESWVSAAVRETWEEIGVTVAPEDLEPVVVQRYLDGGTHGVGAVFRARRWRGDPRPVSECSEVGWFRLDALPDGILPWLPETLRLHLPGGTWFSEIGFGRPSALP